MGPSTRRSWRITVDSRCGHQRGGLTGVGRPSSPATALSQRSALSAHHVRPQAAVAPRCRIPPWRRAPARRDGPRPCSTCPEPLLRTTTPTRLGSKSLDEAVPRVTATRRRAVLLWAANTSAPGRPDSDPYVELNQVDDRHVVTTGESPGLRRLPLTSPNPAPPQRDHLGPATCLLMEVGRRGGSAVVPIPQRGQLVGAIRQPTQHLVVRP